MKKIIIKSQWEYYRDAVIPKQASVIQIVESKKAFYAGARTLLSTLFETLEETDHDEPTEADLNTMVSIQKELDEFVDEVAKGRI